MKVKLLNYTENCERLIACAAKLCYSSCSVDDLIKKEFSGDPSKFINMLNDLGHESPVEHVTFTFGVEGVSRSLLAQITRHRLASFSVQSQRYVLENDFSFVVPPEIENDVECSQVFLEFMKKSQETYCKLFEKLKLIHKTRLVDQGFNDKVAVKKAEKSSCEDARFVLPNACCCKFIATFNARSLLNFFKLRCCNRAQWEIRELAFKMLSLVSKVAPSLFKKAGPNCVRSGCVEGKMSCGLADQVKLKIKNILN